ncbi:TolC family outer membrane protein [Chelatococcus sp. SYSU_G07232]|uniref:TolC family outer membrane protein n=1 Tax=Chelatococcus albus TaxID=3047466 RepID=A0ABT7ACC8_9HYPH|nr:TolC family outer membrane protein [Chelatococcus sp. SYSU_G07232]MDJ1157021.1 TolC family outer membrane protein [Chelatococcus sp. SYSU_G07232]
MNKARKKLLGGVIVVSLSCWAQQQGALAETLESALVKAYGGNPTLNAQRALLRATDENVPRAKSGYRPRVSATGDVGASTVTSRGTPGGTGSEDFLPRGAGVTLNQNIFDGFRTSNSVRAAESQVFGQREVLRNNEQNTLLDGVTAYMNVLRDTATLNLQRNNVEVLQEQLRQTQDRFNVGEVTRTDVAQAEARLAGARSQESLAQANLKSSLARYRQVIGVEPKQLAPGRSIEKALPKTLPAAIEVSQAEHPAIHAALHGVDAAEIQVKVVEGELYPSLGLQASAAQRYDVQTPGDERTSASIVAQLTIPIYEGGEVYARTRQAKETAGQRRLEVDVTRDQVRAAVVSAWGALEAAKAQITAAQAQVEANEIALNGVREEAKVGQRTTLDVLNAQQELLNSRVSLISAQRDRVVNSYQLLAAVGRLSARTLALKVEEYDSKRHFEQVKDKWFGLQTPDGR